MITLVTSSELSKYHSLELFYSIGRLILKKKKAPIPIIRKIFSPIVRRPSRQSIHISDYMYNLLLIALVTLQDISCENITFDTKVAYI